MSSLDEDITRGRWDGAFFAERFMGVKLHPGQVRLFKVALARHKGPRWWIAAYLTICLSAGNRAGKTLVMALVILHSCFYKVGIRPPEDEKTAERWRSIPYVAYHFAIAQDVARLVFNEITNMLQGIHVAQTEGKCALVDELGFNADWTKKDGGEYDWIVFDKNFGGAEIKFRTTQGTKGKGALGRDMNLITFDEAGIEPNLTEIYKNNLHQRRMGTGGQLFFFSTPEEGLTDFADFWFRGDPEQPDRRPRWMSLRMSTRDNIGFGIDQEIFDTLVADMDEDHIKQNIDGYFIEGRTAYFSGNSVDRAFVEGMLEVQSAKAGHQYIQGVDPGLSDRCWSLVFDWVDGKLYGVKAEFSRSRTTEAIVALAVNNHNAYNLRLQHLRCDCQTAIDTTALGGHIFRDLVIESIPTMASVEFGGNTMVKRTMLSDVRTMLDKGQIIMPRSGDWLLGRRQLAGFKLADRKIEQDFVMALACVVKMVRRFPATAQVAVTFDAFEAEARVRPERFSFRPTIAQLKARRARRQAALDADVNGA